MVVLPEALSRCKKCRKIFLGDSIQNILGDVLSCALGYIIGTVFLAVELWWLSIVWIVVSEVHHKKSF